MLEVLNIKDEVHVVILVVLDLDVNNVHVNMVEVRDVVNVIKRLVVALVLETMLEVFRKGAEIYLRNLKHVWEVVSIRHCLEDIYLALLVIPFKQSKVKNILDFGKELELPVCVYITGGNRINCLLYDQRELGY